MYVKNSLEKEGVSQGWGYRDGVYICTSLERLSIEGEVLAFVRYMEEEKAHFLSPLAEYNSQQGFGRLVQKKEIGGTV